MRPLAARRTGIHRRHVDVAPTLVHNHEISCGALGNAVLIGTALLLVALGGTQRLFLRVQPKRLIARPTVHWLNVVPCVAFQRSVCSAIVASGSASNCAHNAACCVGGMGRRRPDGRCAARSGCMRRKATKRLIVAKLTPKVAATSARPMPRSTAANIRWRRSTEYAFIPQ